MQMAIPLKPGMFEQDFLRRLIQGAKSGDADAFERIVKTHDRLVLRLAQQLLLNREAAQDAAQEVFLRLHKNIGTIDETRDLNAWLYRTTCNVCYDAMRRRRVDQTFKPLAEPVDPGPNPEEWVTAVQRKQLIVAALSVLSAREREAVVLRDLEGRPIAEVASILKITEGTVRSHLSTGRIKIKNFVTAQIGRSE